MTDITTRKVRGFVLWALAVVAAMWLTSMAVRAPRLGQEATAIGSIRAVLSAERTFAEASGGQFGGWSCLSAQGCLATLRLANDLLGPDFGERLARAGYRLELSGAPVNASGGVEDAAALYSHYAVAAIPVDMSSGRAFCAEESGQIFVISSAAVTEGRCADHSVPLP